MSSRLRTSGIMTFVSPTPTGGLDAATTAWIAAVVGNGGSVSAGRQTIVNTLIVGLKADGIWTKLDRLWLLAAEDEPSALTDLVATALGTNVNSVSFTIDRGYTGDNSTNFIDSGFNPSSGTPHFVQNDASYGLDIVSDRTSFALNYSQIGTIDGASWTQFTLYLGGLSQMVWGINSQSTTTFGPVTTTKGNWTFTRLSASRSDVYVDGSAFANNAADNSTTVDIDSFYICAVHGGGKGADQISMAFIGGGLTSGEVTSFNSRIQTWKTAVGVP